MRRVLRHLFRGAVRFFLARNVRLLMNRLDHKVVELPREGQSTAPRRWIEWAVIFAACTLFALIATGQTYFGSITVGRPLSGWRALRTEIPVWYPLLILAPVILWLGRRFTFERRQWASALLIHGLWSLAFAAVYNFTSAFLFGLLIKIPNSFGSFSRFYLITLMGGLHLSLIKYWAILGVGYALDYYRKYRAQELQASRLELRASQLETRLAQAQLQTLKMQLHPHFLFNTLHAVSVLMEEDIKAARRMIARLSELLRLTLENPGEQVVSLKQELDWLERYLEIEQIRFQDRLAVQLTIEPETLEARVPNLILQPLVENAIRHGIAPFSSAGRIEIIARRRKGVLQLSVRDDGPGLPDEHAPALKEGIGLSNTRARLLHLYGDAQHFEIGNAPEGGLRMRLEIPFSAGAERPNDR